MDVLSLTIIAGGLLLYSLVSGRLQGTVITAPLVFIIFGFVVGEGWLEIVKIDISHSAVHFIAELTLILVLFADAARIDLKKLRTDHDLPVRMLVISLPLVVVVGTLFATVLFPYFSLWEAALLAALLAPTDAALGQAVVASKIVPVRIRQAINVESGMNDGIALPAVLMFAALASAQHGSSEENNWLIFAFMQILLGPLVGITIGYIGARLLDSAAQHKWMGSTFQGIGILALIILTYVIAEQIGGNGFIAAFVGGMVFGNTLKHACVFLFEFMESEGLLLMLITFILFGATLLPEGLTYFSFNYFIYAILSLTIIRMLPVFISLLGTGVKLPTQLYLGWFGPRGLASILFVLLILEEAKIVHQSQILSITVTTVALSALLHGVSAAPLSNRYGQYTKKQTKCEESKTVAEMPLRDGYIKQNN